MAAGCHDKAAEKINADRERVEKSRARERAFLDSARRADSMYKVSYETGLKGMTPKERRRMAINDSIVQSMIDSTMRAK